MTPVEFSAFVGICKGRGMSKGEIAERLGKPASRISTYLRDGTDLTMALACAAIAAGLEPWPQVSAPIRAPRSRSAQVAPRPARKARG